MSMKNKMREGGSRTGQGRASDCDEDMTISANSKEDSGAEIAHWRNPTPGRVARPQCPPCLVAGLGLQGRAWLQL